MQRSTVLTRALCLLGMAVALSPALNARTLEILGYTSELRLVNVEFPVTTSGVVMMRLCQACQSYSLRVTPATEYIGFDGAMTFEEFQAAVTEIRLTQTGNLTTGVGVSYGAEDQLVTRIKLYENAYDASSPN